MVQDGESSMESKADTLTGCKNTNTTTSSGAMSARHTNMIKYMIHHMIWSSGRLISFVSALG